VIRAIIERAFRELIVLLIPFLALAAGASIIDMSSFFRGLFIDLFVRIAY
jgi:hypothetical protein